jgi:hypothetical protein
MNPNTIRLLYHPEGWSVREYLDGPGRFFEVTKDNDMCYLITSLTWLSYAIKTNTNKSHDNNGPNIKHAWKLLYEHLREYHEYLFDGEKG